MSKVVKVSHVLGPTYSVKSEWLNRCQLYCITVGRCRTDIYRIRNHSLPL